MFKTNPISLKDLLDDAEAGKIQLPDFQRGWVWDDDRIKGLLASISRGFPVGAIMTLEAGGDIKLKSRLIESIEGAPANPADDYLLDGQQRLTSLYQSLRYKGPVNTRDNRGQRIQRWYYIDMRAAMDPNVDREDAIISVPANKRETRNFGRDVVRDLSTPELEYDQHMIPTERLLDSMDWLFGYNDYWQSKVEEHPEGDLIAFRNGFNQSIISAFTEYTLPVISLDKDTPKEAVCTVFEKVNTGGVTLSVFELATATFAAGDENFSLRDDWEARRKRLYDYGVLQNIGGEQFLQAVALLTTQEKRRTAIAEQWPANRIPAITCRKSDILGLDVSDYQRWANHVEAGLVEAAKFLRSQFVFTGRDVPYATQLVPLACIYTELGKELEPANPRALLERWFWSGIFGEVYGGAVETQYGLDLAQVSAWVRGGPQPTMVGEANFIPERLLSLRTRNSAAYKGLYALQMRSGAADWRTAQPLMFATWDQAHIDIHHIFPKRWCETSKPSISRGLYDSVINKTPIDATTNRKIGGRAPSDYLSLLQQGISSEQLQQVLQSHWINPDALAHDYFGESFIERGQAMLDLISQAMGKPLQDGKDVFRNALNSAGLEDQFDDSDIEYDEIGGRAYDESISAD